MAAELAHFKQLSPGLQRAWDLFEKGELPPEELRDTILAHLSDTDARLDRMEARSLELNRVLRQALGHRPDLHLIEGGD